MGIKKILISQPAPTTGKSPYLDLGEKYGCQVVFRSFIKVESISAKDFCAQKVSILDHSAVIFTSRHAIDHFFKLCQEMRVVLPETMKYFCISEHGKTAEKEDFTNVCLYEYKDGLFVKL